MSVSTPQMSQQYSTRVLHFFNRLFQAAEKSSTDPSLNYLCGSMSRLANVDGDLLQVWLRDVILGPTNSSTVAPSTSKSAIVAKPDPSLKRRQLYNSNSQWVSKKTPSTESNNASLMSPCEDQKSLVQENSQLLQALTSFIVKQNGSMSEDVATTILKALIPVGAHILSPVLEGKWKCFIVKGRQKHCSSFDNFISNLWCNCFNTNCSGLMGLVHNNGGQTCVNFKNVLSNHFVNFVYTEELNLQLGKKNTKRK